jgi:uncharacterized membrane protein YeaQ/YmgE (transglycosylase-associated protein family)
VLIFIIGLIVWGFVVGGLARLALPGPDPMPWYATIGLGLAGSLIGGIVAHVLLGVAGGLVFAVLGATLLLYLYPPIRARPRADGAGGETPPARLTIANLLSCLP